MARTIWKGAISFGLVHIPVALVSAQEPGGIDFDWLDQRSMDPVGYQRVNKKTGEVVDKAHIVKGVEYGKGHYVVLSEDEIRDAHPRSTQTIELFAFVDSAQIPLQNIDTPYYLSPDKRGGKVYALLREGLVATGKVALARVVVRTRQHLAALIPVESALVLIMLRWPAHVRGLDVLDLESEVTQPSLKKSELDMARRLIDDLSTDWQPQDYEDTFSDRIMALVERKARAGKLEQVEEMDEEGTHRGADIVDLTELLKRSLHGGTSSTKRKNKAERTSSKRAGAADK